MLLWKLSYQWQWRIAYNMSILKSNEAQIRYGEKYTTVKLVYQISAHLDLKQRRNGIFPCCHGNHFHKIHLNRKNDLILIMTPEKQDKTLELSKHWSVDSTPARNEVIMKRTYPVKSVKCDKICSNY